MAKAAEPGWRPEDRIAAVVEELGEAYGDDLRGVTLFGSVPRGEAVEGVSDVNLLVLVEDVTPRSLLRGAPHARRAMAGGFAAPLMVAWDEWRRSADVFPMEIADMRDDREVLFGDDPLDGLLFSLRHLRLQAERELRRRLLGLRQGMLVSADDPEGLGKLFLEAAPSVATDLRTLLRLARREPPDTTAGVARSVGSRLGTDVEPFLEVWEARRDPEAFRPTLQGGIPEGVFDLVERMADYVDTLGDR